MFVIVAALAMAGCGGASDAPPPAATPPWSEPVALPAPGPPPSADIAQRPDGTAIAVWSERVGGSRSRALAAVRDRDGAWAAGTPIAPDSPTPIQSPRVVVDSAGVATAVWALWDRPQGQVFAFVQASRQAPDGSWDDPVTLSRGTNGVTEVLAAVGGDGRVVVVWSGSERRNGSYFAEVRSASRSPQGRWGFARVAGIKKGDPFLTSDGLGVTRTGRARLIWLSFPRRGFPGGVMTSGLGGGGRWTPPRRLVGAGRELSDLSVATGSDGTMTAVWRRRGDGTLWVSRSKDGAWSVPRSVAGGAAEPNPLVVAGGHGEALVVFERWRARTGRLSLRVMRSTSGATVGPSRSLDTRVVPTAGDPEDRGLFPWQASAAFRPDGRAVVIWPRSRRRGDGASVTTAIVARRQSTTRSWGDREQVVAFATPVVGVFPKLDALPDGRLQVRWRSGASGSGPTQLSTSTP